MVTQSRVDFMRCQVSKHVNGSRAPDDESDRADREVSCGRLAKLPDNLLHFLRDVPGQSIAIWHISGRVARYIEVEKSVLSRIRNDLLWIAADSVLDATDLVSDPSPCDSGMRTSEAAVFFRASVVGFATLILSALPAGSGYVLDVGASSCGKWIEARRVRGTTAEVMHRSWIYGYLAAAAALLEGEAKSAVFFGKNDRALIEKAAILSPRYIDADAINGWMDNYCSAHPSETVANALRVLLNGLKVKTGYLEEAVCETSDLGQEGRAGCRRAFEANKAAALTLEDGSPASLTLNSQAPHRLHPRPATPVQPTATPVRPTIFQSLMQWLNVQAAEERLRSLFEEPAALLHAAE